MATVTMIEQASPPALEERLAVCARTALLAYFARMAGHEIRDLHRFVLDEVERPLLEIVLEHTGGNQTHAARILGISRGTLRARLTRLGLAARPAPRRSEVARRSPLKQK